MRVTKETLFSFSFLPSRFSSLGKAGVGTGGGGGRGQIWRRSWGRGEGDWSCVFHLSVSASWSLLISLAVSFLRKKKEKKKKRKKKKEGKKKGEKKKREKKEEENKENPSPSAFWVRMTELFFFLSKNMWQENCTVNVCLYLWNANRKPLRL